MQIDDLKTAWKEFEQSLKYSTAMNEKMITALIRERSRSRLSNFKREYIFFLVLSLGWSAVFAAILIGNPFDFTYAIQYLPTILLLFAMLVILIRLYRSLGLFKTNFYQADLIRSLKNVIRLYERHQQLAGVAISFMIAGGVLFAFSFMPTRIAAKGLQAAMLEMLLITAISLFIYFLAFRLGVFNKHKHTPGFDQDLQELEQLKEMAKELE
jgi:hypothetical protein